MREEFNTIKKNLQALKKNENFTETVRNSQVFELSSLLKDAEPREAAEIFSQCFEKSPICPEMLDIARAVCGEEKTEKICTKKDACMIACQKNPLSLSAVRHLTKDITTVRISEQSDFRSSCEEVSRGGADYCILPVSSSSDGYYPTFSKLMKAYDLKICREVRITKPDSDEELQFALLSRSLEIRPDAASCVFSFTEENKGELSLLLSTLSLCGCYPQSITSSPLEYNMDRFEHRVDMELGCTRPAVLLWFLEAVLPGHTVLGIY